MTYLWEFLAGLGIFLYAMWLLEDSLRALAGRAFKLFLRKHTSTRLGAISSGALVTGILQSSSVVNLMTLAFVGAGIINMRNALAIVFGANFGTTLDSWIVALLGFKVNIENFTLPIIGFSAISLILFSGKQKIFHLSRFFLGFGFVFLGLGFIKESMQGLVVSFDIRNYITYSPFIFLIIGFILTALIQSSSATIVITLSALASGAIPYDKAVPIVIGSELGTTVKIVIGAIHGIPAKKRVALGNVLFNMLVTVVAFSLMSPLISLIRDVFKLEDPLIGLVLFQSMINLIGVILFFPFMRIFSEFLERQFDQSDVTSTSFIKNVSPDQTEEAIETFKKEALVFIHRVIRLNQNAFHIPASLLTSQSEIKSSLMQFEERFSDYPKRYKNVKTAEGEMLSYYLTISESLKDQNMITLLNHLLASVRSAMYSAKSMKDIRHDRRDFKNSANDEKYRYYKLFQKQISELYIKTLEIIELNNQDLLQKRVTELQKVVGENQKKNTDMIYIAATKNDLSQTDLSTLMNVNQEIFSSCSSLLTAILELSFDPIIEEKLVREGKTPE